MDTERVKRRCAGLALLVPLMLLVAVPSIPAQMGSPNFQISSSVLDDGGGQESSTNFRLNDSIGQAGAIGTSQSPHYSLSAGFEATTWSLFVEEVPRIRLSSEEINWGNVTVGGSADKVLTIFNDGLMTLEVTEMASDNPQYVCAPENVSVCGLRSANITITFSPDSVDIFEATLTIVCNDPDQEVCFVALRGEGVEGCAGGDYGDVTGDGKINVIDVLGVVNHILLILPLDEDGQCRADCNCDGSINILDAIGIVNVILGIGECGPSVCKPVVTPDVMKFFNALAPHFATEDFTRLMALVRIETPVPVEFSLAQNYPNPFNPTTTISYTLPSMEHRAQSEGREAGSTLHALRTALKIYNILGQEVRTLVDEIKEPGYYTVTWDGRDNLGNDVASGVYFYRLTTGGFAYTKRLVLVK